MKKGFTLIELLAVLAVLAMILLIAFSIVTNVVDQTKNDAYKKNEFLLINATKNYTTINEIKLPKTSGETLEISLATLKTEGFLSSLKSPYGNYDCSGYVTITNINNRYSYIPHLRCDNQVINSSSEDALQIHYAFDTEEEPTINLAANTWGFYAPYHSVIQSGTTMRFTMVGANSYIVINQPALGAMTGRTFSYQGYIKKNGSIYTPTSTRFSTYNLVGSISNYYFDPTTGYFEGTMYFDHASSAWILHWPLTNLSGDVFTIENFQVEEKPFPSKYTATSRTGKIYNLVSNNDTDLVLNDTPYWTPKGKKGGGYELKTASKITMPLTMNNTNYGLSTATYTYSFWVNLNKHNTTGYGLLLGMANYAGFGTAFYSNGSTSTGFSTYFRNTTATYMTTTTNLNLNTWYNIVSVLDRPNNRIRFYLNGILIDTRTITTSILGSENRPFGINLIQQTTGAGPWVNLDAKIDEVRIYNRILSSNEIKTLYETYK